MKHILIVEDEVSIADAIKTFLTHAGFRCSVLNDATEVPELVKQFKPDLLILDVMLPGGDGITICKHIRSTSNIPIIMLTAKSSEAERLIGLEAGADDYICKPFSAPELVLRVKAILRRTYTTEDNNAQLTLLEHTQEAQLGDKKVALTTLEFSLLALLIKNAHRIYSRDAIMDLIYSDHRIVSDRTVDSHVSNLRRKLKGLSSEHELIRGVYGSGYKYVPLQNDNSSD